MRRSTIEETTRLRNGRNDRLWSDDPADTPSWETVHKPWVVDLKIDAPETLGETIDDHDRILHLAISPLLPGSTYFFDVFDKSSTFCQTRQTPPSSFQSIPRGPFIITLIPHRSILNSILFISFPLAIYSLTFFILPFCNIHSFTLE